ncbi:hypothetical protein J8F10_24070 [Gemmata sp. G18]|uniref:Tail assembly chaperone n=1 Tax=Gemmata palustris TaxID=2822762 RepID=A0ABS5BX70_9BACT|nr:hypothetical protein [Gemmata palustris]MBP3958337.1 hypothetical protein [Gemmata palustris]
MTEHLVSPDYSFTLADRSFTLDGSFATLKAVQHAFKEDLLAVQARVLEMRQDEIALLLATGCGEKEQDTGAWLLDEVGVTGTEYQLLRGHLMAWLLVAMTPKRERAERKKTMGELIGRLTAPSGSSGTSTRNSHSASSAGPRPRFGRATSGS